ncbi:DNA-directed rna polymerase III 25 kD polypeptide [Ilyonectria robusta]
MAPAWSTSMVRHIKRLPPRMSCFAKDNAVEFRMVVFRPFKGEVMLGRIRSSTPAGINLRTDFFDDIFVPFEELPEGAE